MLPHALFKPQRLLIAGILIAGAAVCALICQSALQTNGVFGFPLDDPWIHLQFARTFRHYGRFSYFANEMVTSGSTSPLYTFMLAAGLFITSNEMMLSYVLGIVFFAAGAFVLSRISEGLFRNQVTLIAGGVTLFVLEPHLQWAALSGMETTLFILLLLIVWHLYQLRSPRWLGITAGLLLWTRPEAVIFFLVLAIDVIYNLWWVRRVPVRKGSPQAQNADYRRLVQALPFAAALCIGYVAFNLALSGSLLPNTYAAKTQYYGSGGPGFSAAVYTFLTGGHMPVLAALAAIATVDVLWKITKRTRQDYLVPVLWCVGLYAAYAQKLPFLYQEGRYLMPLLPCIILLGIRGIEVVIIVGKTASTYLQRKTIGAGIAAAIALVLILQFAAASWQKRGEYTEQCKYISDRQVKTAFWIRDNLPPDAVIGTHDVGAIAFYSGRRIVDMVGLVSPDMIENIGSFDRLKKFLTRNHVTHLAVLRNWFEVVNQNPKFQTDERTPEIMEVFEFDPSRTHFTPQNASALTAQGAYYLGAGQVQRAGSLLEEALRIDPQAARPHFYLGLALVSIGKNMEAEREIRTALGLQPDLLRATLALAHIYTQRNDPDNALRLYREVEEKNPTYAPVYQALAQFYGTVKKDGAAARMYMERYNALTRNLP